MKSVVLFQAFRTKLDLMEFFSSRTLGIFTDRTATRKLISLRLVRPTSPLKSLRGGTGRRDLTPRTVHTKRFEKQVAGTSPKTSDWFQYMGQLAKTNPCD